MSRLRSTTVLSPLIERDPELETLQTVVRAGRGVVVIEAAAGLGKTALLEQAAALAGADGWTVRRATPSPLEQRLPFGVVRALLEAPAREHPDLVDGAACAAGELLRDGVSPRGDSSLLTIAHSTLWFCSALAADAPLALVVDDAQWADRMSLGVLAYLARRIEDLPLALFVGTRTSSDLLSLLSGVRAATVLQPRPLSARGAAELIRRVAPETPGTVCRDVQRAAGGVPWLVSELALTAPGEISASTRARVRRRLAELAARERAVIEALAVVGEDASRHVLAEVAGVSVGEVGAARDLLVDAGLLTADCDHFTHPVIAGAIVAELSCGERERLHRAAARALIGAGAEARAVAGHLLDVGPSANPEVTAWLVAAAEATRGEEAATYLRRAVDEGAPTDDRPALLAALGVAAFDAALPEAYTWLHAAADEAVRTPDVVSRLAGLGVPLDEDVTSLDAYVGDSGTHARRVAALAHADDVAARGDGAPHGDGAHAARGAHAAARVSSGDHAVVLAHRAHLALADGDPRAVALAVSALEEPRLLAHADRQRAYELAARVLVVAGHERAEAAVQALVDAAGSARTRAAAAALGAELALRQGRLADAEDGARRALAYPDPFCGDALAVLVSALAERGAFEDAQAAVRGFDGIHSLMDGPVETPALREARARLALAEGAFEQVLDDVSGGPVAALALAHLGRRAEAAAVADAALAAAERFGAALPIAAALHARAVAEPDPALRATICERGLMFAGHGLEAVRLRLELGAALAYLGSRVEARDALRPALADADAAGAVPLAQRARRELVATGLRPRQAALEGAEALTPRQRQICELAAVGKGNRAIAQELFLSIKTVETHLAAGYRKLGVNTRAELAAELAA
ncbi:regulatory LuxR family protein [Solirubrobacter pauli]|uniref:Regulatory LuxR family protein n=1 Tax=Solirubrobacter pauli TaxID=166793 RepID=A0A660LCI4_9ACTN|nr:LuxR family transcriptional regulator [Solirubrobacter pauli]RKQ90754.1 regulatory LuxR family protein [Solirubrobacter pauli]